MTIVEHIEYRASDHDAFVAAFKVARAVLGAARGCRSVDVTHGDGAYRVRIEWRSAADRDAHDPAPVEQAFAAFENRGRSVDSLLDVGGADDEGATHDATALRRAFGQYPSGVAAITAAGPNGPVVMVVSSFVSVSMAPTLVSFCAAHSSTTWPTIADAKRCCVNLLAVSQGPLVKQLSKKGADRFEGVTWSPAASGAPILAGVVGWLDCTIAETRRAGDHDLVILAVRAYEVDATVEPLVFHRSGYRVMVP